MHTPECSEISWPSCSQQAYTFHTVLVLAFMEFLFKNDSSPANISNYLAGLRALHVIYGLDTEAFRDDRLALFVKSLKINAPLSPKPLNVISVQLLVKIVKVCDKLKSPHIFKPLYLFTFFSFLRLSNILPHSARQFDPTRHLTRGDLIFTKNSCTVIIKWSKTLQNRKDFKTIVIPFLGASPLCPITSLQHMFTVIPASKNSPLFCLPSTSNHVALSDSTAIKHLEEVSSLLGVSPPLTFHTFRRSGTSWAFANGVPLQEIIHHGTWSSDSVWRYIQSVPHSSSAVSSTFQQHLMF